MPWCRVTERWASGQGGAASPRQMLKSPGLEVCSSDLLFPSVLPKKVQEGWVSPKGWAPRGHSRSSLYPSCGVSDKRSPIPTFLSGWFHSPSALSLAGGASQGWIIVCVGAEGEEKNMGPGSPQYRVTRGFSAWVRREGNLSL